MEQNSEQKQYKVSEQTAAYMDCLQELNNLTQHIADVVAKYNGTDVDRIMQPVCEAATELQEAMIMNLLTGSIREASAVQDIYEI